MENKYFFSSNFSPTDLHMNGWNDNLLFIKLIFKKWNLYLNFFMTTLRRFLVFIIEIQLLIKYLIFLCYYYEINFCWGICYSLFRYFTLQNDIFAIRIAAVQMRTTEFPFSVFFRTFEHCLLKSQYFYHVMQMFVSWL